MKSVFSFSGCKPSPRSSWLVCRDHSTWALGHMDGAIEVRNGTALAGTGSSLVAGRWPIPEAWPPKGQQTVCGARDRVVGRYQLAREPTTQARSGPVTRVTVEPGRRPRSSRPLSRPPEVYAPWPGGGTACPRRLCRSPLGQVPAHHGGWRRGSSATSSQRPRPPAHLAGRHGGGHAQGRQDPSWLAGRPSGSARSPYPAYSLSTSALYVRSRTPGANWS